MSPTISINSLTMDLSLSMDLSITPPIFFRSKYVAELKDKLCSEASLKRGEIEVFMGSDGD